MWGSGTPHSCKFLQVLRVLRWHTPSIWQSPGWHTHLWETQFADHPKIDFHFLDFYLKTLFLFFYFSSLFADTLNFNGILIWNDTTHVQMLFINWLRVVVWCCSFLCLFVCLFAKYALRVPPAVTRLTVYRRLRV